MRTKEKRWLEWVVPAAFCLLLFGQLLFSVRQISQTVDESTHLYAGYRILKCGDFSFGPEHPPLARMVAAAPLLAKHLPINCNVVPSSQEAFASLDWLYSNDWETALSWARVAVCGFALGLCITVWIVARRMFGFRTAVAATALMVFEPNLLAYGALVTTDMVLTFTMLLGVFAFYLWIEKPSPVRLVFAGFAIGLTLVAKNSGVVILPALFLLAVADPYVRPNIGRRRWRVALRNLLAFTLMVIVAAGVVWAVYGFRFTARPDGIPMNRELAESRSRAGRIMYALERTHALPEAYLHGLHTTVVMTRGYGGAPFVLGRVYARMPWFFFPLNIVIRYTAASLLLIALALLGARFLFRLRRRELLFMLVPACLFLYACMRTQISSGIRHTLPMVPFVLIFAAAACVAWGRRLRWLKPALVCLIVLHAVSSLHSYPNYLSYSNEFWGGPANTYRYLPWVDLGGGLKQARAYVQQHPGQPCWLGTPFLMDPRDYGIPCQQFGSWVSKPTPPRLHGTVILSSSYLSSINELKGHALESFAKAVPKAHIAESAFLVYEGDFDTRIAAGISETVAAYKAMGRGDFDIALQHAAKAVKEFPEDFDARFTYCRALTANDRYEEALTECNIARTLTIEPELRPGVVAGIVEAETARHLMTEGNLSAALQHASSAVQIAPQSATAHFEYCEVLLASRKFDTAAQECETARTLTALNRIIPSPGSLGASFQLNSLDELNLILTALGR